MENQCFMLPAPVVRLLIRRFGMVLLGLFCLQELPCAAQSIVDGESLRYQQERMVFKQWDQDKFTPEAGFLSLNPYYWLTWGLFYPNYHETDLRPLSATGPETQRLALTAAMSSVDAQYQVQSDTVRNTMLSEVANQSGAAVSLEPLWRLYFQKQFKPLLNYSATSILGPLSPEVSAKLVSEGLYSWYTSELERLKERLEGARSTDMDRGSRIMAYYRLLMEYKKLAGIWAIRTSSAAQTIRLTAQRQQLRTYHSAVPDWTPQSDIKIVYQVLNHLQ